MRIIMHECAYCRQIYEYFFKQGNIVSKNRFSLDDNLNIFRKFAVAFSLTVMKKGLNTFLLVLLVVLMLVGMHWLPPFSIGGEGLRQVDLLADVQADSVETTDNKDEKPAEPVFVAYEDTVPEGMTPIEDYRDSLGQCREMDAFYAALDSAGHRTVRIAYFGDSFIEGDILTAALREQLQSEYGGRGVGFVDIQSAIAGFRTTVVGMSRGWQEHCAIGSGSTGFNKNLQGINGRYYIPAPYASIDMRCQSRVYAEHLDTVQRAIVYFTPSDGLTMRCSVNGTDMGEIYTAPDSAENTVEALMLKGKIGRINVGVNGQGRFYGIALEGNKGIVLDCFSMRGSSGYHIGTVPEKTLQRFRELRKYDLIVLHFGLNMASPTVRTYEPFKRKFKECVEVYRRLFPDASLLLVSMNDRDVRESDGKFHTMKGVLDLVETQRTIAQDEHIAFWNLQQAMGGEGSMARLQQEGKANRDYTHINFKGGEVLGKIFFDVLQNGKLNYDLRLKRNAVHPRTITVDNEGKLTEETEE